MRTLAGRARYSAPRRPLVVSTRSRRIADHYVIRVIAGAWVIIASRTLQRDVARCPHEPTT